MEMTFGMVVHIAGGGFALLAGATALIRRKGSSAHKQAGTLYVLAMVMMTLSGAWISWQHSVMISTLAGLMSFYLVMSGWLTLKIPSESRRRSGLTMLLLGFGVLAFGLWSSETAASGQADHIGNFIVPVAIYATFTAFTALGVIGDVLLVINPKMSRQYLLSRHIWRMCIPLYVAASSFFEGQADVFPEALRYTIYLSLPEYAVIAAMFYWLSFPIAKSVVSRIQHRRVRS